MFEIAALFLHRVGDRKGGNFKIKKFFNWIALFLYWLHFKSKIYFSNSSVVLYIFSAELFETVLWATRNQFSLKAWGSGLPSKEQKILGNPTNIWQWKNEWKWKGKKYKIQFRFHMKMKTSFEQTYRNRTISKQYRIPKILLFSGFLDY